MQTYTIHLDGLAYQGENLEVEYESKHGQEISSVSNQGAFNDLIIGPGEPLRIYAPINLNSHMQRIFRRMRDHRITVRQIVINVEEE